MEETALAHKPDVPMPALNDMSNPPDKLAIAVISIMRKLSGRRIEFVQTTVLCAEPKTALAVPGDARNVSGSESVGVVRIVKVPGEAFDNRIEFVHSGVGGNPQIPVIVFHEILDKIGA